ncbi:MAG TPA: CPBP family intramembrane glutamic endopeptidase [Caulobacteraceae bacterium]
MLGGRWGAWMGLLATSLIFCGLHVVGGARAPLAAINIFLAGLFFGLLALRSGGLVAPITAHFAWNWAETGLFATDPNPGAGPFGALVDLDLTGPSLWSGGADTMNGSLATTLVLGALILGLMLAVRQRRAAAAARSSRSAPA